MVLLTLESDNSILQARSLINSEMTITFPDEACAVNIHMESIFIAEATIQKQKINVKHLL